MTADAPARPPLLVLTSTYPRYRRDSVPAFVHELSRRLAKDFRVTVLAPHAPGSARTEIIDGVEVIRFRYAPDRLERLAYGGGMLANLRRSILNWLLLPGFLGAQYFSASHLIRSRGIRVVHAHWLLPQGIIAGLLAARYGRRIGVVMTAHGSDLFRIRGKVANRLRRWILSRATAVTVVSEGLKAEVECEMGDMNKLRVLPMGTNLTDLFIPADASLRDEATLLFVGRLSPEKGADIAIQALSALRPGLPELRLVLAGSGPEGPRLRALAERLGVITAVEFRGFVTHDRLPDLYRRAAMLILPSRSEGFGLTLVEALGCECPVIASDLPGIRDIVLNGDTGLVVAPGDPHALAAAIRETLGNPGRAREMAHRGRNRCLKRFDWNRAAADYRSLLKRVPEYGA